MMKAKEYHSKRNNSLLVGIDEIFSFAEEYAEYRLNEERKAIKQALYRKAKKQGWHVGQFPGLIMEFIDDRAKRLRQ